MRLLRIVVVVLGCLGCTVVAEAGLAPAKASQLVTLIAAGQCAITGHPNAAGLQFRIGGDGSSTFFTVPPKQVLVLTYIEMSSKDQIAGHVFLGDVLVGTGGQGNFAALRFEPALANGTVAVSFAPTNGGIVVKSGNTACIELVDTASPAAFVGAVGSANGFLAADK